MKNQLSLNFFQLTNLFSLEVLHFHEKIQTRFHKQELKLSQGDESRGSPAKFFRSSGDLVIGHIKKSFKGFIWVLQTGKMFFFQSEGLQNIVSRNAAFTSIRAESSCGAKT